MHHHLVQGQKTNKNFFHLKQGKGLWLSLLYKFQWHLATQTSVK